jgi:hypothetical protein
LGGQSAGSPIPVALGLIEDRENDPIFSAASLWEIGIKHQPGRTDFAADPRLLRRELRENGYTENGVTSSHVLALLTFATAAQGAIRPHLDRAIAERWHHTAHRPPDHGAIRRTRAARVTSRKSEVPQTAHCPRPF